MGSHDVRATLAVGNSAAGKRRGARGFTLIELLIVVTILGIFLTIGMPALSEFVADQRVKTVTSNIVADIAFARAKAIETGRRVNMNSASSARAGTTDGASLPITNWTAASPSIMPSIRNSKSSRGLPRATSPFARRSPSSPRVSFFGRTDASCARARQPPMTAFGLLT